MSSIGTGIATSVAQVAHNASRAARSQDKKSGDAARATAQEQDTFIQRLYAAGQTSDPDAELPDRQAPGYEQLYLQDGDGEPLADASTPGEPDHEPPQEPLLLPPDALLYNARSRPEAPLYQHLDIQA